MKLTKNRDDVNWLPSSVTIATAVLETHGSLCWWFSCKPHKQYSFSPDHSADDCSISYSISCMVPDSKLFGILDCASTSLETAQIILFKIRILFCCFILGTRRCMALYFNTTISDPMQKATPHSSLPAAMFKFSLAFHVPRFKPNQTHVRGVGQSCLRQSERPCNHAWVVPGTQTGVDGHASAGDSPPGPVRALEMRSSYWFSWKTHHLLICVSLSRKIPTDWTAVSWMSVKTVNFDQNHLQSEIWWTWFLKEFFFLLLLNFFNMS